MLNQLDESKYPLFVSFLRNNNIYGSYEKNTNNVFDHNMPHFAFTGAFLFYGTEEGPDFWREISCKWENHYKQFKDESI